MAEFQWSEGNHYEGRSFESYVNTKTIRASWAAICTGNSVPYFQLYLDEIIMQICNLRDTIM